MNKTRILALVLFSIAFSRVCAFYADTSGSSVYQYVSPVPFSSGHNPETGILLRFGPELDLTSLDLRYVRIAGEKSGNHRATLRLAGDRKTLVIMPETKYALNERVYFSMKPGIRTACGIPLPSTGFWFRVRESEPPRIQDVPGTDDPPATEAGPMLKSASAIPAVKILNCENPSGGYLFATFNGKESGFIYAFDNNGTAVFYREFPYQVNNFSPHPTGVLAYHDYKLDAYVALDSLYHPVDTFRMANGYMANMHEFVLLDNGHALMLAYDYRPMDLSQIIEGGDSNALVIGFIIQELDENKDLLFQWRSWDHLEIADTYEACKSNFLNRFTICDFAHANSIQMDSDTSLIVSTRNLSEITRINRRNGEIIWRMGGKNNEFDFPGDPRTFRGQHTALKHPSTGNITLLDNGYRSDSLYSRGIEYRVDEEGRTATLLHEYLHVPQVYGYAMGNLQRLENGNTLVYWGAFPGDSSAPVTEYDSGGRVVFEAAFDNILLPSYRCVRSQWKPKVFQLDADTLHFVQEDFGQPAVRAVTIRNHTDNPQYINKLLSHSGRFYPAGNLPMELAAGETRTVELCFDTDSSGTYRDVLTFCCDTDKSRIAVQLPVSAEAKGAVRVHGQENNGLTISPVPFHGLLQIRSGKMITRLDIFDIRGRLIRTAEGPGCDFRLSLNNAEPGIYLLHVRYLDGTVSRSRILKVENRE